MVERIGLELEASLQGSGVLDPVDGALMPRDGPGLGIEPDPAVLQGCRIPDT